MHVRNFFKLYKRITVVAWNTNQIWRHISQSWKILPKTWTTNCSKLDKLNASSKVTYYLVNLRAKDSLFPEIFFKKLIMGFCREINSEQRLILNIMLNMRSYSSGNWKILVKCPGFSPTKHIFGKDLVDFRKNGVYLTQKSEFSCKVGQKSIKWARCAAKNFINLIYIQKNSLKNEK